MTSPFDSKEQIHAWLNERFPTREDLYCFCYDEFPAFYNRLTQSLTQSELIDIFIEWADASDELRDRLRTLAQQDTYSSKRPNPPPSASRLIYISYAESDQWFANQLESTLFSQNFLPYAEPIDNRPWQDILHSCPYFLLVLSPATITSKKVKEELNFALERGKEILIIRHPDFTNFVVFRDRKDEIASEKLLHILNEKVEKFKDKDDWLERGLKFIPDRAPFTEYSPENDENLSRYFVDVDYFADFESAETTFLCLERGIGGSSTRIMFVKSYQDRISSLGNSCLSISYSEKDIKNLLETDTVALSQHTEIILRHAVTELWQLMKKPVWLDRLQKLPDKLAYNFNWLCGLYGNETIPVNDRVYYWHQEMYQKEAWTPLQPNSKKSETLSKSYNTPLKQLSCLTEIIHALGIKPFYILIDIDSSERDAEKIMDILEPLAKTPDALNKACFKFILPYEIHNRVSNLFPDMSNIKTYKGSEVWRKEQLKALIKLRLDYYCDFSDEVARQFENLFEKDIRYSIMESVLKLAGPSPRNLVRLVNIIFEMHTQAPPIDLLISNETYQLAAEQFRWISDA